MATADQAIRDTYVMFTVIGGKKIFQKPSHHYFEYDVVTNSRKHFIDIQVSWVDYPYDGYMAIVDVLPEDTADDVFEKIRVLHIDSCEKIKAKIGSLVCCVHATEVMDPSSPIFKVPDVVDLMRCFERKVMTKLCETVHIKDPYTAAKDALNYYYGHKKRDLELYEALNKPDQKGVDTGEGRDSTQIGLFYTYTLKDMPEIEQVIFDPPATIVYWKDGTKTIVRVDQSAKKKKNRDKFREDYGLAMAVARKYFGGRKEFKDAVENGKHCK